MISIAYNKNNFNTAVENRRGAKEAWPPKAITSGVAGNFNWRGIFKNCYNTYLSIIYELLYWLLFEPSRVVNV